MTYVDLVISCRWVTLDPSLICRGFEVETMALNSQSSSQLSSISSHFRNPKAPSAANFFMKLASSSDESSKPSVRIAAGAESTPNARFSARRRESVSVQQLERPLMEYMSLPASQYPVLDAERIERIDDRTFKCYTKKLHQSVLVLPDQAARALPLMSATSLARNFPTSVLLQEQRDENRACLQTIKEDKASQVTLERRQMEARFSEQEENNDIHSEIRLKDFHHQLLNMRGSWYPFPSFQMGELTMSSVTSASGHTKTQKLKDVEPCKVLALAKKALSASKQAVLLSEDSHSPEADVNESLIPDSRSIDFIDCPLEDKIVRSKRLLEKRSRRRESKLKFMVEEAGIPKRLDLRKKKSEPYDPNDPLRLFLRGAETTRLLTAKEESVLVAAIQDLMRSEEVKSRLQAQFDREPTLVEWAAALGVSCRELKAQLHSGNNSREKLIHANFRLVVHIAKQYQGKGLSLQDLMQEGSTGLMRSVEKFKPQAGCRFASYAYWWIRQSVRRAIFHHSRTIRLPDNVYTLLYKVTEAKRSCIQDGNHQPTQEDIASRVGITVEKLDKLLFTARMPISMQQTIWSDQDTTFQEVTADAAVETPDMSVSKQLMRQHVRGLMSILSSKEKKIICLRFGIDEPESRSLSEVGAVFGLSKERVRQLESRALYKLKQTLCSQGLDAYADLLV